jgi:hypothetical protein
MAYYPGKWLAVCDVCGMEYLSDELQKRWDNLMVCRKDYETRHPQEFLRPVQEHSPPWTRPEPEDDIQDVPYVYTPDPPPDGTFNQEL